MNEIFILDWIWKKTKDTIPDNLSLRIPNEIRDSKLPKGNYLIKIYKLESEINKK